MTYNTNIDNNNEVTFVAAEAVATYCTDNAPALGGWRGQDDYELAEHMVACKEGEMCPLIAHMTLTLGWCDQTTTCECAACSTY